MKTTSAHLNTNYQKYDENEDHAAGDRNRNAAVAQVEHQRNACEEELYRLRYGIEKLLGNSEQGDSRGRQRTRSGSRTNPFRTMKNGMTDWINWKNRSWFERCTPCCRRWRSRRDAQQNTPNGSMYRNGADDQNYDSSSRMTPNSSSQRQSYNNTPVSASPSPSISSPYMNSNVDQTRNNLKRMGADVNDPAYQSLILQILESKALDCLCTGYSKNDTQRQISQALSEINQRPDDQRWDSASVTSSGLSSNTQDSSSSPSISPRSMTPRSNSPSPSSVRTTPSVASKRSSKLSNKSKSSRKQSRTASVGRKTPSSSKSKTRKKPPSKNGQKPSSQHRKRPPSKQRKGPSSKQRKGPSSKQRKGPSSKHRKGPSSKQRTKSTIKATKSRKPTSSKSRSRKAPSKSPSRSKTRKKPQSKRTKKSRKRKKRTKPTSNNQVEDHRAVQLPTFTYSQSYHKHMLFNTSR